MDIELKEEYKKWIKGIIQEFEYPMFFTLTFKYSASSKYLKTELIKLKKRLSRTLFNRAYKSHGKMIDWIVIEEGIIDSEKHVHGVIDIPLHGRKKIFHTDYTKLNCYRLKSKFWQHGKTEFIKWDFEKEEKGIDYLCKFKSKKNYSESFLVDLI